MTSLRLLPPWPPAEPELLAPHLSTLAVSSARCPTSRSGGEGLDLATRDDGLFTRDNGGGDAEVDVSKSVVRPPGQRRGWMRGRSSLTAMAPDLEPWPRTHCSASLYLPLSGWDDKESGRSDLWTRGRPWPMLLCISSLGSSIASGYDLQHFDIFIFESWLPCFADPWWPRWGGGAAAAWARWR
ncbi:hypothetical protein NL676_000643 [Syzygium grande]|nr:hypothetical protein NL676_000643 [Syzygium grande]